MYCRKLQPSSKKSATLRTHSSHCPLSSGTSRVSATRKEKNIRDGNRTILKELRKGDSPRILSHRLLISFLVAIFFIFFFIFYFLSKDRAHFGHSSVLAMSRARLLIYTLARISYSWKINFKKETMKEKQNNFFKSIVKVSEHKFGLVLHGLLCELSSVCFWFGAQSKRRKFIQTVKHKMPCSSIATLLLAGRWEISSIPCIKKYIYKNKIKIINSDMKKHFDFWN